MLKIEDTKILREDVKTLQKDFLSFTKDSKDQNEISTKNMSDKLESISLELKNFIQITQPKPQVEPQENIPLKAAD